MVSLVFSLGLCRARTPTPPGISHASPAVLAPWSEPWMLSEAARFLDEPGVRRGLLMASLTNPQNSYSRQRIGSYGLESSGWDALPPWNPRSAPVSTSFRSITLPEGTTVLWDNRRPTTLRDWVSLGREVFFGYPLRAEVFMEYALAHPEILSRVGMLASREGIYPGLRVFEDIDGRARVAITCALCHSTVERGEIVPGRAHRAFDYGLLRLTYHRETGAPIEPELAERMARWGPGRADVTEDEAEDPVSIPDLWGLRYQSALTQAGTLRHTGPGVLAIRQETQLLHSNHQRIRPPRELAWALAMYLYSLEAPRQELAPESPQTHRGGEIFEARCAHCHSNEAYGGAAVSVSAVGTDPALANGSARGTGMYRPPALIRVRDAGPYLHHGAVDSLDDLFDPERLRTTFTRGALGPGAVPGHTFGTELSDVDRSALVGFLRTL